MNVYGASPASSIATIRASDVPSQPTEVETSRVGLSLKMVATLPAGNGAALDDVEVLLYRPDTDDYAEETGLCDASAASFLTTPECTLLFTDLMSNFGYVRGQLVKLKFRAQNDDGWGMYSNPNSDGQTIMTVPA